MILMRIVPDMMVHLELMHGWNLLKHALGQWPLKLMRYKIKQVIRIPMKIKFEMIHFSSGVSVLPKSRWSLRTSEDFDAISIKILC